MIRLTDLSSLYTLPRIATSLAKARLDFQVYSRDVSRLGLPCNVAIHTERDVEEVRRLDKRLVKSAVFSLYIPKAFRKQTLDESIYQIKNQVQYIGAPVKVQLCFAFCCPYGEKSDHNTVQLVKVIRDEICPQSVVLTDPTGLADSERVRDLLGNMDTVERENMTIQFNSTGEKLYKKLQVSREMGVVNFQTSLNRLGGQAASTEEVLYLLRRLNCQDNVIDEHLAMISSKYF
jgi:hypothetical protein